jgi:hypothetical protein
MRADPVFLPLEQVLEGSDVPTLAIPHRAEKTTVFTRQARGGYLRIFYYGVDPMTPLTEQHPEVA